MLLPRKERRRRPFFRLSLNFATYGKTHTHTRAHERALLTIWRDRSRLNISCANCRKFQRQRATPTWVSDIPVFASPCKIERSRKRHSYKPNRYVSNTAQATAILVRVEPSWVCLLEMGRLVVTKKRNRIIHADLCCQKLTARFNAFENIRGWRKYQSFAFAASVCAVVTTV